MLESPASVYESLCAKINLAPVASTQPIEAYQTAEVMSDAPLDERIAVAVNVFLKMIQESSQKWTDWTKACWTSTSPTSTRRSAASWTR